MASTNIAARSVNELSLAAWFGGSLYGAIASTRSGESRVDDDDVHDEEWDAWRPIEATALVAQLLSGTALTLANRRRVVAQAGVGSSTVIRTLLTLAATAATVEIWRSTARSRGDWEPREGAESGGEPGASAVVRWSVPVLTGAMLVVDAWMGEQQRPATVLHGLARRFRS